MMMMMMPVEKLNNKSQMYRNLFYLDSQCLISQDAHDGRGIGQNSCSLCM